MKTRTAYCILALCLGAAPVALGQSAMPDALGQALQPQPLQPPLLVLGQTLPPQPPVRSTGLGKLRPATPEQLAVIEHSSHLTWVAVLSLHAGRYAQAEAEARQSVSYNLLYSGLAQEVLAAALEAQGKDQEALQQYQTVVEHYDKQPRNLLPYALLLLKSGQWEQALAVYNRALPWLPDVGRRWDNTPVVHDSDLLQANSHFSPDVPDPAALEVNLHIARGLVYGSMCDWTGASLNTRSLAEFGKALQLAPDSGLASYFYGTGWQHLSPAERAGFGTEEQAKASLQKAVKFGKGDVKVTAQKALMVAMKPK